jgi:NAD(P)H dehydrogenase (quinone)
MAKKVLLILDHPSQSSLCKALLNSYQKGAESSGAVCQSIIISELNFNGNLSEGYKNREAISLDDDVLYPQRFIKWGNIPALTKGFIDRVFLPGFTLKHHKGLPFPEKLLNGKIIRLFVTMDAPKWWFYIFYNAAQYRMLRQLVFGYVGFNTVKFSTFGAVRTSTEAQQLKWFRQIEILGKKIKY